MADMRDNPPPPDKNDDSQEPTAPTPDRIEHTFGDAPADPSLSGRKIGSCTLRRIIGTGGMGAVYEAIQENPRRTVAVKLMRNGLTSKRVLRRFEFESQILARLRHPGIAQVFEAGTHHENGEDTPYFVMEYIPGALSITAYARKLDLDIRERMKLFLQVCEAVQHGHLKGIVHRDLKPGNILIASNGRPKIIDFGVARSTDSDLALTTLQTDIGQILGTVQYMSPEQCEADPNNIDTRSDVYALGVILHELLTGDLPYDITTAALHEAVRIVREDPPARLSSVDRRLKGDLETITGKALEKERRRRYQSASALSDDIGHWLDDEPISARPPGAVDGLMRFARRHKAAASALSAIFVVLLIAIGAITATAFEANRQRAIAEQAQQQESDQRLQAEAIKDFLTTMIASIDPAEAGNMDKQLMVHTLNQATERISADFHDQPYLEAELRETIGKTFKSLGLYEQAEIQFALAMPLFESHADTVRFQKGGTEDKPALLRIMGLRVSALIRLGKEKEARDLGAEYLQRVQNLHGPTHTKTLRALRKVAVIYLNTGQFGVAEELLDTAAAAFNNRPPSDAYVQLLIVQGQLFEYTREAEDAEATFRQAIDMSNSLGDDYAENVTRRIEYHLAMLLCHTGRFDEALPMLERELTFKKTQYGDEHPNTLETIGTLGAVHATMGNLDAAEPYLHAVYEGQLQVLGAEHPSTLLSMGNLGKLLQEVGKLDAAEAILEPALQLTIRATGPDSNDTLHRRRYLGGLRHAQGRYDEAHSLLTEAKAGLARIYGPDHRYVKETEGDLAALEADMQSSAPSN